MPSAFPTRAVVFDLDGTLVRSMENHFRSYVEIFRRLHAEVTFHEVCLLEGKRAAEVIALLAERRGIELPPGRAKELGEEKQKLFRHFGHPEPYPGAHELLEALKAKAIPVGLATGTNRENVKHMLGKSVHLFDAVVTGEDVARSKPDPEPYRRAFSALGVDPSAGLVVENAPLGIASAAAAGAPVVAVAHTLPPEHLPGATAILKDLPSVQSWILERLR